MATEKKGLFDTLLNFFNPAQQAAAQPQNAASAQQAKVRDYINNYGGKTYGIKDADIGYKSGADNTPGMVTLGGYDLLKANTVDANNSSWANENDLKSAIDSYAASRGMAKNAASTPYTSKYSGKIDQLFADVTNPKPFAYDAAKDPVYKAYEEKYQREGDRANKNTMANAAELTGGRTNSWAVSAAAQAQDRYNQALSDTIPQLEANAYNRYNAEKTDKYALLNSLQGADSNDYSKYSDERNFQYGQGRDAVADQQYNDQTAYGKSRDAITDERYVDDKKYSRLRDTVADTRYADETTYSRGRDTVADQKDTRNFNYTKEQDNKTYQLNVKKVNADIAAANKKDEGKTSNVVSLSVGAYLSEPDVNKRKSILTNTLSAMSDPEAKEFIAQLKSATSIGVEEKSEAVQILEALAAGKMK